MFTAQSPQNTGHKGREEAHVEVQPTPHREELHDAGAQGRGKAATSGCELPG